MNCKQAINSGDYEQAYLTHQQYQTKHGWQATEQLNRELRRDCGGNYLRWRDWLLTTQFTPEQPNGAAHHIEQLLASEFMDKQQLTNALTEMGLPALWVRNKANGQLFTLPDPHQRANKVMYASTTKIMEQGYTHTLTYHHEEGCIGWWRGVNTEDLTDEHRKVLGAALRLINFDIVTNTTHTQPKSYHYYKWTSDDTSLTLIKVSADVVKFWRTGA